MILLYLVTPAYHFNFYAIQPTDTTTTATKNPQLKDGSIGSNSYVPDGLTPEQYKQVRAQEKAKKEAKYAKNASKAGKFEDFTKFYLQRGTSEGGSWLKAPARGHRMVKTKFDWSGKKNDSKGFFN